MDYLWLGLAFGVFSWGVGLLSGLAIGRSVVLAQFMTTFQQKAAQMPFQMPTMGGRPSGESS